MERVGIFLEPEERLSCLERHVEDPTRRVSEKGNEMTELTGPTWDKAR